MEHALFALPPAPASWAASACELPDIGRAVELFEARSAGATGGGHRQAVDAALHAVGLEPDERRIRLFERLRRSATERR